MSNKLAQCFDGLRAKPDLAVDLQRYNSQKRRCYLICFTPRSGSSWVSDMLLATKKLGRPLEWANPSFVRQNAESLGCSNIVEYMQMVRGKMASPNGVFGMEASFFQLNLLLSLLNIFDFIGEGAPVFYLTRRDFLMQGISLYKATSSGIFHARDDQTLQAIRDKDAEIPYDADKIKEWVLHIMQQEFGFERFFKRYRLDPPRFTYEMVRRRPQRLLGEIAASVNEPIRPRHLRQDSSYTVIRTDKSDEFAERFRRDERAFLAYWRRNRGQEPALS